MRRLLQARRAASIFAVVCAVGLAAVGLPAGASQPGGSGEIVFMRHTDNPYYELYAVNADGSGLRALTEYPEQGAFPSFFAAGSKIAYLGSVGCVVMNADGSDPHSILGVNRGLYLSASPDGTHFMQDVGDGHGNAKIETVSFDGSNPTMLFPDSGDAEWYPSWSPDSNRIAYFRNGQTALWIANQDGTNPHQIDPGGNFRAGGPAEFSPDGRTLVIARNEYLANGAYKAHIYVISDTGTDLHEIPAILPNGDANSADFSPDGQNIVFGLSGVEQGIYTTSLDGTRVQRLTTGDDAFPAWQPITAASQPTTTSTTSSTTTTSTTVATNVTPRAVITLATSGRFVQVGGARSADPDGSIASYQWWWGDKTSRATTKAAWHSYAYAGTYRILLIVTDNHGATNTSEMWLHVA